IRSVFRGTLPGCDGGDTRLTGVAARAGQAARCGVLALLALPVIQPTVTFGRTGVSSEILSFGAITSAVPVATVSCFWLVTLQSSTTMFLPSRFSVTSRRTVMVSLIFTGRRNFSDWPK